MTCSSGPRPFVRSGDLAIRRMRDHDADYRLVAGWLSDERVLEFYHGRDNAYDTARVRNIYGPCARGEAEVVRCIMVYEGNPIGYLQYYPVLDGKPYEVDSIRGDYGIDLFIGESGLWDRGIGTRALSMLVGYLFTDLGAKRLLIDPQKSNHRAIRCYEKCGFTKIKLLPKHELHEGERRDAWLMAMEAP